MSNPVAIGRIGAPHGLRGFVRLQSFTEPKQNILSFEDLLLKQGKQWRAVTLESIRESGATYVAKFAGIENRDQAATLTHASVGVDRALLPELEYEDEQYWVDLIGLHVHNESNHCLGVVVELFETGANDVLVVKDSAGKEQLIPYVPDLFISKVDKNNNCIHVKWQAI